ncbi:hypothetical protein C2G38_2170852 [Gigaspora rosea]|uniref:Uncharacterized protein n=1 Tax=Gigaspora rosea TaxID=44941 RepID=A0A397VQN7_9GLOM|nr:hypothetical protein C2G38_2170852 [Gigaspora rosea]
MAMPVVYPVQILTRVCITLLVSSNDGLVNEDRSDNLETIDLTNTAEIKTYTESDGYQKFVAGWCLKKKQKRSRASVKRLTPQVKGLLETIFHTGTASPRNKMSVIEMQQELLSQSQEGEINETDIPEVSTISNWIGGFARAWKRAMAERSLEENKNIPS